MYTRRNLLNLCIAGVALTGDPDYRIVMEAYPFVTRKIISDDSPALQRALRDILYRYVFFLLLYLISGVRRAVMHHFCGGWVGGAFASHLVENHIAAGTGDGRP